MRRPIVLILGDLEMNWNLWNLECHISSGVSPLLILEWHLLAYLLVAHRDSSGSGEFLSWVFLSYELGHKSQFITFLNSWIWMAQGSSQFLALIFILWARSQVVNHHLAYLLNLVAQGVILIPNIIFVPCIFFNCFRFWVFRMFWSHLHLRIDGSYLWCIWSLAVCY